MMLHRTVLGISCALFLGAGSIAVWPVSRLETPSVKTPVRIHGHFDPRLASAAFDRAALPARIAATTDAETALHPDPTAPLKRYQYLGMAASEESVAGVFGSGDASHVLRIGETLEGFIITTLDAERAVFSSNNSEFVMLINKFNN